MHGGWFGAVSQEAPARTSTLRGERRLSSLEPPSPLGYMDFQRKGLGVVLCLTVRLNKKARRLIGQAEYQEMFWLESMEAESKESPGLAGEHRASSLEEAETSRVRWYRLRGRTYFSS